MTGQEEHWARVRLVQGDSGAALWDLSGQVPEARIAVGSGPDSGWQVRAPGVTPRHFELMWDGKTLWLTPIDAARVFVAGDP
ncbi:MAG: hypothetical protein OEY14_07150, partial [Myxococcales bacterium]|nr:hypothetical protein [Myxococcales bacterium]